MKVLYLGPEETLDHVRQCLPDYSVFHALDLQIVEVLLPESSVILDAYMRVRFPRELLSRASALKLVVTATTGADHIDQQALAERGIPLLTLKGQQQVLRNITPAAEHSWLLLMACARQLRPAVESVVMGRWDRNDFPGIMLRGRTLGVIGCGRIGTWMARYAAAFGMHTIGYDPIVDPWPDHIEKSDLDSLLVRADFISVHVPLDDNTRGLLGPREFALIKSGAILINTSRGEIVDQNELEKGLRSGQLGAAGLDVLAGEPKISDNPLVEYAKHHPNLIITPHIGGYSLDAVRYVLSFSCQRIKEYFA